MVLMLGRTRSRAATGRPYRAGPGEVKASPRGIREVVRPRPPATAWPENRPPGSPSRRTSRARWPPGSSPIWPCSRPTPWPPPPGPWATSSPWPPWSAAAGCTGRSGSPALRHEHRGADGTAHVTGLLAGRQRPPGRGACDGTAAAQPPVNRRTSTDDASRRGPDGVRRALQDQIRTRRRRPRSGRFAPDPGPGIGDATVSRGEVEGPGGRQPRRARAR